MCYWCLWKWAWVVPLNDKKSITITKAFQELLYVSGKAGNVSPHHVSRTSPSNFAMTPPKDPIWLSLKHPNRTCWRCSEIMSRRCPNPAFRQLSWQLDSGRPQGVLRMSPRSHVRDNVGSSVECLKGFFYVFFGTYLIDQIYL